MEHTHRKGFRYLSFQHQFNQLEGRVVQILYFLAHMQVFCCLQKCFIANNILTEKETELRTPFQFGP